MSNLNPEQFNDSWLARQPTDVVWEEHDINLERLVDFDAKHDPFRKGYPRYTGQGSSYQAHQGIISRDYEHSMREARSVLASRGEPVPSLDRLGEHVATVALANQRQVAKSAEEQAAGGPLPEVWGFGATRSTEERRAIVRRNLPHVLGHEVDLERHLMGMRRPR